MQRTRALAIIGGLITVACIAHATVAQPREEKLPDPAEWLNDAGHPKVARMTYPMFRAVAAAIEYRRSVQAKTLRPSEQELQNFTIEVTDDASEPLLRESEKGSSFLVGLVPKYQPGAPAPISGSSTPLGRTAAYVVRKKDFTVVRAEFPRF